MEAARVSAMACTTASAGGSKRVTSSVPEASTGQAPATGVGAGTWQTSAGQRLKLAAPRTMRMA